MADCTIRWRPSGGRGEFEFVPAHALDGREIVVRIDELGVSIPAEVRGTISQGKPRLRKHQANNRQKLHLLPLVMAIARLPSPAREDKTGEVSWPLESKNFIASHLDCEIESDDGTTAVLRPRSLRILHSDRQIDLHHRFLAIREDISNLEVIAATNANLAEAIDRHWQAVQEQENSAAIQAFSDELNELQSGIFGTTNSASVTTVRKLPPTELERDVSGKEGRVLVRLHSYRERDRKLVYDAKALFKKSHGRLYCECCGFEAGRFYGDRGEDRIHAHHRTPVEELLPDSVTRAEDLAMVCPNCHDIIHAKRPWISVEDLKEQLVKSGHHFFDD